jgi:signal transduction histidine kinase
MRVEVADGSGQPPELLSRVRARGIYPGTKLRGEPGLAGRLLLASWNQTEVLSNPKTPTKRPVLKIAELRQLGASGQRVLSSLHLEGQVLATGSAGWIALRDDTGAMLVELEPHGPSLRPGQTIVLEGTGAIEGTRLRLRDPVLVDNDGVHTLLESSGTFFLKAGKYPLHLSWFNREGGSGLELLYQGPDMPRQRVPASALFHPEPEAENSTVQWAPGVVYSCYEGAWAWLPDAGVMTPTREGIASDFYLGLASRPTNVGLEFSCFLDVPRDGLYTFSTRSDDGSLLYLGEELPRLLVTGSKPVPAPARLAPRQFPREDQQLQWSQVEGNVTFVSEESQGLGLDLSSEAGRMHVEVANGTGGSPLLLLNSRVRVTGLPQITYTTDGQRLVGGMVTPSLKQVEFVQMAPDHWTDYPALPVGALLATNFPGNSEAFVHVRGHLYASAPDEPLVLVDGTDQVLLETAQPPPKTAGAEVEALGRWARVRGQVVLQCGYYRALSPEIEAGTNTLPLLTTIEQVKSLSREEAQRGYPVQIRGILTAPLNGGFFIQDSTWAIFVDWDDATNTTLKAGDYWEVGGKTYVQFAPNILADHAVRIGVGTLPEPLHPTWDQLNNGSLDTRYVEVQGIVTSTEGDSLMLLTRAGKINVQLPNIQSTVLRGYENALIRARGCIMPGRDTNTQQVVLGRIRLLNYSVTIDEPAPADPFAATLKRAADLLLFDTRAGAIQRVKIIGQVIHSRHGEYFLLEGGTGLRFIPKAQVELHPGDLVEVVGFPELGGPSPVLREALVRRTGHERLPYPVSLFPENLLSVEHEATLVRVEARLANLSFDRGEQVLELQAGTRGFVARVIAKHGFRDELLPGSKLQLTGIYSGQGGDRSAGREIDSFELLLNSPVDINVLERPGWWTLRRLFGALGIMAVVLLVAMLWAFMLKRRVDAQTKVIRQKVETEAILEERARIARELHDTLEQALVGTSLQLNALAGSVPNMSPASSRILEMARSMVRHGQEEARRTIRNLRLLALDKSDLPTALAQLADRSRNGLPTDIQASVTGVPRPLPGKVESHLLRIGQEATTNAVKHARAKAVRLELDYQESLVRLSIRDDGCGFDAAHAAASEAGHFGLLGMRERAEKIAGTLDILSTPGEGTTIQVTVPLARPVQGSADQHEENDSNLNRG